MPLDLQESPVKDALVKRINGALGVVNVGDVSLLLPGLLEDGTTKIIVRDPKGRPTAVVLCAPPVSPGIVELAMRRAGCARAALGPKLGRVIVQPIDEGEIDGLSYTILPYYRPLSSSRIWWRLQRRAIARVALPWLREVTEWTLHAPTPEEIDERFDVPLANLASMEGMVPEICEAAAITRDRLAGGAWRPKHVLMHGDLWKGNLLLDHRSPSPSEDLYGRNHLMIIDWPGSETHGYGMFDLIKLSESIGVKGPKLRREIEQHCVLLECELPDARSHLVTAFAHAGMNLNYFPFEQYKDMCLRMLRHLDRVL